MLSGVNQKLDPEETLWYHRTFENPLDQGERLLLHFGAVDQMCVVYVNGKRAGCHKGGYLPFTLDITPYLEKGENELAVGSGMCRMKAGMQGEAEDPKRRYVLYPAERNLADRLDGGCSTQLYQRGKMPVPL